MDIIQELKKIGLKEKEGKTYFALIELGSASVSAIAKKSGIKRPTVYHAIAALLQSGLLAKTIRGKRTCYTAVSPERLKNITLERQKVIEQIAPILQTAYNAGKNSPVVRFFEGKEGMAAVYEEFFSTYKTIYAAVSFEHVSAVFTEEEDARFFEMLRRNGGTIFDLVKGSPEGERHKKAPYRRGVGRLKFLPDAVDLKTDIMATNEKIAFFSFKSLLAVVIEDEDIAHSQKSLLQYLWRSSSG